MHTSTTPNKNQPTNKRTHTHTPTQTNQLTNDKTSHIKQASNQTRKESLRQTPTQTHKMRANTCANQSAKQLVLCNQCWVQGNCACRLRIRATWKQLPSEMGRPPKHITNKPASQPANQPTNEQEPTRTGIWMYSWVHQSEQLENRHILFRTPGKPSKLVDVPLPAEHLTQGIQKINCTWSSPKTVVAVCPSSKITWSSHLQRAQLRPSQPSKAIPSPGLLHFVWADQPWAETKPYQKTDGANTLGLCPAESLPKDVLAHAPWSLWRSRGAPEKSCGLSVPTIPGGVLHPYVVDCQVGKWWNSGLSTGGHHLRRRAINFLEGTFPRINRPRA